MGLELAASPTAHLSKIFSIFLKIASVSTFTSPGKEFHPQGREVESCNCFLMLFHQFVWVITHPAV